MSNEQYAKAKSKIGKLFILTYELSHVDDWFAFFSCPYFLPAIWNYKSQCFVKNIKWLRNLLKFVRDSRAIISFGENLEIMSLLNEPWQKYTSIYVISKLR